MIRKYIDPVIEINYGAYIYLPKLEVLLRYNAKTKKYIEVSQKYGEAKKVMLAIKQEEGK